LIDWAAEIIRNGIWMKESEVSRPEKNPQKIQNDHNSQTSNG
jgi:hypothetical protein